MTVGIAVGVALALLVLPFLIVYSLRGVRQRSLEREELWFRDNSLEAFRVRHPETIKSGRFTCPHCGGEKLFVRTFARDVDLLEHVCNLCGKALYVSRAS